MREKMVETFLQLGLIVNPEDVDDPRLLITTVEYRNLEIVEVLLKNGADVNVKNSQGETPIVYAIKNDDTKMTKLLLTNGADIKEDPKVVCTAVEYGNLEIVEVLLKNGADVNTLDNLYFRESLLHRTVKRRQVQMVKLLIEYGANVNVKNSLGETPIVYAIQNRDKKMIDLRLTNGADIKEDPKVVCTAVENGNLEIVEDLLKNGADVNTLDNLYFRNSLLHCTVKRRQVQMVKLLIKYGANVNVKNSQGETPIVYAIKNDDTKMTKLLLTNGADIKDIKEDPEVVFTAIENGNLEIVEVLLKNGADVNVKNSQGETPIVYAIENHDTEMTKLLLTNGADIKEDPKVVCTAVENGNLEIVEDLLKNGADVNTLDNLYFRESLLHRTVKRRQVQMVKLLIEYGANVNVKNSQGETPIVYAIYNGDNQTIELRLTNGADIKEDPKVVFTAVKNRNLEIVEVLLKNGADLNVKNSQGETPIVYAIENDDTEMTKLLLTNGADIKEDPKVVCTAVEYGNLEIVEVLLKNGADVNTLKDLYFRKSQSLLHRAVESEQVQMVKLLMKYGANVNGKNSLGETPIVYAIQNRDKKMIELLLTNGAGIKEDPEVLCAAVANGNLKIVEDILMDGADVNLLLSANSSIGRRVLPLHEAVMEKQVEMAKLLIKYGANVNAKDSEGATPIFFAINKRDTEMIELLLMNGADIKFHPDIQRVKCPTTKLLKQHIAKVKAAGLYVSERNLLWISRDYNINHFLDKCDAEVQIMKSEKIDDSCASFYDILTKDTSELAKNESIVKALKSDDYKTKFPIYASTMDSRFRRGVEREELLEQVRNKFLPFLFKSLNELPFLCTEKIFSYLSDKDLRILLVSCKLFNK